VDVFVHVLTRSCCVGTLPNHSLTHTSVSQPQLISLSRSLVRSLSLVKLIRYVLSSRSRTRQAFSLLFHTTLVPPIRHTLSRRASTIAHFVPGYCFFHPCTRWHYETCSESARRSRYRSILVQSNQPGDSSHSPACFNMVFLPQLILINFVYLSSTAPCDVR